MNRRRFLFSAASALTLGGTTGCVNVTELLFDKINKKDYRRYTETVDHILFSADGTKLVFIGPEYHYIFDMPADFLPLLNSPLHNKLTAKFDKFQVDLEAKTTGRITLELKERLDNNEKALAETLGFKNFERRFDLQGLRYSATGFDMPANITPLKKSYVVNVHEEQSPSVGRKSLVILTPLAVAADGALILVMVGGMLFITPFALLYDLIHLK